MSRRTFCPIMAAAGYPKRCSAAGLTDSIRPRSSIVIIPSTAVCNDGGAAGFTVAQRHFGHVQLFQHATESPKCLQQHPLGLCRVGGSRPAGPPPPAVRSLSCDAHPWLTCVRPLLTLAMATRDKHHRTVNGGAGQQGTPLPHPEGGGGASSPLPFRRDVRGGRPDGLPGRHAPPRAPHQPVAARGQHVGSGAGRHG